MAENLKTAIRRNPKNKKLILIHGKKMKICMIILYEMLNVIFDQNSRFNSRSNKHIKSHLKAKKMKDLVHNFVLGGIEDETKAYKTSIKLIKGI